MPESGAAFLSTERWYDFFSYTYDLSCERMYWPCRLDVRRRVGDRPGRVLLDLCCGTGANFPHLAEAIAGGGRLVGIDASAGMLRKAPSSRSIPGAWNTDQGRWGHGPSWPQPWMRGSIRN